MKILFLKLFGLVCIVSFLAGCTPAPVDLNYSSNVNVTNAHPTAAKKQIFVVQARDLRNAAPDQIANIKYVTYTQMGIKVSHFTNYTAKQPIANVVTNVLKENLQKAGYQITDNDNSLNLSTNIMDLTYNYDYLLSTEIMLQFKLTDPRHNKALWSHTYKGTAKAKSYTIISAGSAPSSSKAKELFGQALDNAVEQFLHDSMEH